MDQLSQSKQDYLETILDLTKDGGSVRSIEIAAALGYSRASVSRAIGLLKAEGFLEQEPYGQITLTLRGRKAAKAVRKRHDFIKYYLVHLLGVSADVAEEDACKMEHIVSRETLQKLEEASILHQQSQKADHTPDQGTAG